MNTVSLAAQLRARTAPVSGAWKHVSGLTPPLAHFSPLGKRHQMQGVDKLQNSSILEKLPINNQRSLTRFRLAS